MFDSIGWGEIAVIALAALFIFGPERLPSFTRDLSSALRRARTAVDDLRGHVDDAAGEDLTWLRDVDLARYTPKNLVREHLLGDDGGAPRPDPN